VKVKVGICMRTLMQEEVCKGSIAGKSAGKPMIDGHNVRSPPCGLSSQGPTDSDASQESRDAKDLDSRWGDQPIQPCLLRAERSSDPQRR
jgi:hypothetical protein